MTPFPHSAAFLKANQKPYSHTDAKAFLAPTNISELKTLVEQCMPGNIYPRNLERNEHSHLSLHVNSGAHLMGGVIAMLPPRVLVIDIRV